MAAAVAANENAEEGDTDLFASFNVAFEPVRTESDWLSRDPKQVDLYVDDPLCGFSVSDASLASLMEAGVAYSTNEATEAIRKDLPIFLLAGDADPVGLGGELVKQVANRYRDAGIADVTLKLYPGARHEVFNETNRTEVEADFVAWATRVRDALARRNGRSPGFYAELPASRTRARRRPRQAWPPAPVIRHPSEPKQTTTPSEARQPPPQ